MSGFATLAPPYSMPSASHGDVELSDSTTNSQSRALNQFLAGVELKAFKIAQAALRHEDDALDAVQDAMLQLARAYSERPAEEWKPLFYRILENRIRDMQRRRTVRGRVISWLPFRADDEDDEQDPLAQAPSFDPQPPRKLEIAEAMEALEKAIETLPRRPRPALRLRFPRRRAAIRSPPASSRSRRPWRRSRRPLRPCRVASSRSSCFGLSRG